jgi:hypothetical protein
MPDLASPLGNFESAFRPLRRGRACAVLSDLPTLKTYLRVPDAGQDALLSQNLLAADRALKLWVRRDLEFQVYTEFRDGPGTSDLALFQRPVRSFALTGTLVASSPTITGISSTANLLAGMPVTMAASALNQSAVPNGTTIVSVDSPTQVTMSANAVASGAFPLSFGLAAWLDSGGFYGDGNNSFPANSQLSLGLDCVLVRDQPDGTSKRGILRRLGGGAMGSMLAWPFDMRKGTLTARLPPTWPNGYGNIKIVYAAGFGVGAPATLVAGVATGTLPANTTIPSELTYCCNAIAGWIRQITPVGTPVATTQPVNNVIGLLNNPPAEGPPNIGTVRDILTKYREMF